MCYASSIYVAGRVLFVPCLGPVRKLTWDCMLNWGPRLRTRTATYIFFFFIETMVVGVTAMVGWGYDIQYIKCQYTCIQSKPDIQLKRR